MKGNTMTEATNTQAVEVKKTKAEVLAEKIASTEATLAKLRAELESLTKFDNIEVGGTVGFVFGRGDDKKNLHGEVQGVGKLDNGVEVIVVLVGKGTLDVTVKRIPKSTINAYVPPIKPEAIDLVAVTQADALLAGA
jgi:hypothetical protein